MKKLILSMLLPVVLAGCQAKVDGGPIDLPPSPPPEKPKVKPTLDCKANEPVNGKVDGKIWRMKSAAAFASGFKGMWDVSLFEVELKDPCREFGSSHGIMLRVPQVVGDFDLLNEKSAVFYNMDKDPQVSKQTSNGRGRIDKITGATITGTFEGYVDETTGACGQLMITRCN